jgi:hypothetical protein
MEGSLGFIGVGEIAGTYTPTRSAPTTSLTPPRRLDISHIFLFFLSLFFFCEHAGDLRVIVLSIKRGTQKPGATRSTTHTPSGGRPELRLGEGGGSLTLPPAHL